MKRLVGIGTSLLLLLFVGFAAPTYAYQGQGQEEQHPKEQQKKKPQDRKNNQHPRGPEQSRPPAQPARPDQPQRPGSEQPRAQRQRSEPARPSRQVEQQPQRRPAARAPAHAQVVQPREQRAVWQKYRARDWQRQHRTWRERGGYDAYVIPEVRYTAYFGPSHGFRVASLPLVIVDDYPRFEYEGYWFAFLDPWPPCWSPYWYQTDVVYIVYTDDGYYLYDATCPAYRVAIAVYLD